MYTAYQFENGRDVIISITFSDLKKANVMPPTTSTPRQRFAGVFLLGTAALAIFDFWIPGIVLLLGGCILLYRHWQGLPPNRSPVGLLLVFVGAVYWLYLLAGAVLPGFVFPLVAMGAAVALLTVVDLSHWLD